MEGKNRKDDRSDEVLKKYGIIFQEPELIEKYYQSLKGVIIADLILNQNHGLVLDLDALPIAPIPFKEIFIKWLVQVNLPRIKMGSEPLVTYQVVMQCPLWKVVRPPFKKVGMSPEGMFNQPKATALGKKQRGGSINKKK